MVIRIPGRDDLTAIRAIAMKCPTVRNQAGESPFVFLPGYGSIGLAIFKRKLEVKILTI